MRRPDKDIDPIGPATIYGSGRGAYATGAAPTDTSQRPEADPAWNAPTIRHGRLPSLIDGVVPTLGQERGYRREGVPR
jgi:hypothetical protein